jgi:hypothetical protein
MVRWSQFITAIRIEVEKVLFIPLHTYVSLCLRIAFPRRFLFGLKWPQMKKRVFTQLSPSLLSTSPFQIPLSIRKHESHIAERPSNQTKATPPTLKKWVAVKRGVQVVFMPALKLSTGHDMFNSNLAGHV